MPESMRPEELHTAVSETLSGLQADSRLRARILTAASAPEKKHFRPVRVLIPAAACCAAALLCVVSLNRAKPVQDPAPTFTAISAGNEISSVVRSAPADENSVLVSAADADEEAPMVSFGGRFWKQTQVQTVDPSLTDGTVFSAASAEGDPYLASDSQLNAGFSTCTDAGAEILRIASIDERCAVAVPCGDSLILFQRASFAGKGPAGDTFEQTFSVRGCAASCALNGKTLSGETAQSVLDTLLDRAVFVSADAAEDCPDTLTVTLDSGLILSLGVAGTSVSGCGTWSCPEFFEAFDAASAN